MEEQEFWKRLEFRICAEFQGLADKRLRQERWEFTLIIDPEAHEREAIDWLALLPADELTGWLSPDLYAKTIAIEPLNGYAG